MALDRTSRDMCDNAGIPPWEISPSTPASTYERLRWKLRPLRIIRRRLGRIIGGNPL